MTEPRPLYSTPSLPALAAYVSTAMVLFFAGYNLRVARDVESLRREVDGLRRTVARAEEDRGLAALPARSVVDPEPRVAPAPLAPAPRIEVAVPRPAAPAPRVEAAARPAAPTAAPVTPAVPADISLARAPGPDTAAMLAPEAAAEPAPAKPVALPVAAPRPPEAPVAPEAKATEPDAAPAAAPKAEVPGSAVAAEAGPSVSGQVLATNPEQMRVILSLGASSGVEAGKRFNLYRGNAWVGDIRVSKVYSDMCMAEIITPTSRGIRVGDVAKFAAAGEAPAPAAKAP